MVEIVAMEELLSEWDGSSDLVNANYSMWLTR
jgi:hypothetical protein